uniref:Methyltransferase domain-containing protein n=1 Tax=Trichobilharzia regenti TaxID=157069 RepID=A0AA85IQB7_TRIRE|nr:unnamed protein product [Trichobilharzia regenti]
MDFNNLDDLLHNLLLFILEYHWLYNFQWIGDLFKVQNSSSGCHISSVLDNLPISWKSALQTASLEELQMFVSGISSSYHWPESLLNFSNQCRQYTRLLSNYILLNPNHCPLHTCHLNVNSMCTDLITSINVDKIESDYFLKVSQKKSYELKQMSTLIQAILSSVLNNESRISLSQNQIVSSNELIVNNDDQLCGNFQTFRLINETILEKDNAKASSIDTAITLVDIGSGLGYLPNYVGYRLLQSYDHLSGKNQQLKVISIECDEKLHCKALKNLQVYDSIQQTKPLSSVIERILFRVELSNLDLLQTKLHQLSCNQNYLLTGLHCCGDLSQSIIELFHKDETAKILLLVGCCYHKMTVEKFPTSDYLREAMVNCDSTFIRKCISPATLRLACQHSPLIWLNWTEHDSNKHRIRLLARLILDLTLCKHNYLSNNEIEEHLHKRLDPVSHCEVIKNLLTTGDEHELRNCDGQSGLLLSFDKIYTALIDFWNRYLLDIVHPDKRMNNRDDGDDTSNINNQYFIDYREHFESVWKLIPGLLALQQLLQPLLENIVLFDRLWCLRETGRSNSRSVTDPYQFSGYIRIFDPFLSPRCMALLVYKSELS